MSERDATGQYLSELTAPLLSAEQEVELAQQIEAGVLAAEALESRSVYRGDATDEELELIMRDGELAKRQMIESNLRFVVSKAKVYGPAARSALDNLDHIQEGNVGLMTAVERFDYREGNKFSTYAAFWVNQAILKAIKEKSRTVRFPRKQHEAIVSLRKAELALQQDPNKQPVLGEIAEAVHLPAGEAHYLIELNQPSSYSQLVDDFRNHETIRVTSVTEQHRLPDPYSKLNQALDDAFADNEQLADILRRRFSMLDSREWSVEDLSQYYGMSVSTIKRREKQAKEMFRMYVAEHNIDLSDFIPN